MGKKETARPVDVYILTTGRAKREGFPIMDDVGLIMQDATKLIRAVPRQVFQLSQNALYTRCDLHLSILWLIRFLLFLVAAAFLLIDPDSSCHSPDRPCDI